MSGFLSNFISLISHDKAGSPKSKILDYVQIICKDVSWTGCVSILDKSRIPEQIYVTVTYVGLLLTEAKEMLCRFIEEQLWGELGEGYDTVVECWEAAEVNLLL